MGAEKKQPTISIITATLNVAHVLPRLIDSLATQTDQDFEWVVADGGSTDGTLKILHSAEKRLPNVRIDSRPDCGIYDALNRAIRMASGDYYLVVGADDILFSNAVTDYRIAYTNNNADFVTAKIKMGEQTCSVRRPGWSWLFGQRAYVSGHAVGLAIRRELHQRFGWYDRTLSIAADQLFILHAIKNRAQVHCGNFIAGEFSSSGVSSQNILEMMTQSLQAQIKTGHAILPQIVLFAIRIIKNRKKIKIQNDMADKKQGHGKWDACS